MMAAAPALSISVEFSWVNFWAIRWSGGGLFEVIVVVVNGKDWVTAPVPPVEPAVVVCVKICVGDDAANSLIV